MPEENKIKDAEIESVENDEEREKNRKRVDFLIEMALLLILGILIGIAVKTEANKRITIGFNDYKMKIPQNIYNINKMQIDVMDKMRAEAEIANENAIPKETNPGAPEIMEEASEEGAVSGDQIEQE